MSFWGNKGKDDANQNKGQQSPQSFSNDTSRKQYQAEYNHTRNENQQKDSSKK